MEELDKMKIKNLMFLSLIFILLFSLNLKVLAQSEEFQFNSDSSVAQARAQAIAVTQDIINVLKWFFGSATGSEFVVYFCVFMILWIMFSDALRTFSPLSLTSAYIVGFLMALIAGVTRGIAVIMDTMIRVFAVFGAASMFMSLMLVLGVYLIFHFFLFTRLTVWLKSKAKRAEMEEEIGAIMRGRRLLREMGRTRR